jgi:hypothetical protein
MLLPQLDDIHPALDAGFDETFEVGPVGCA